MHIERKLKHIVQRVTYSFTVSVYEIPSGKVLAAFSGHLKIVYDLCWSRDDRSLLSASSDGTVRYVSDC